MATVSGVVEMFENPNRWGKVSIKINGAYYNTQPAYWKGPFPSVGDTVEFDDGGKNYIKNFKILPAGSASASTAAVGSSKPASGSAGGRTFPVGPLAPERTINRQNALTNAVAFFNATAESTGSSATPDDVIAVARMFESYTTGDLDVEEAQQQAEAEMAMYNSMGA